MAYFTKITTSIAYYIIWYRFCLAAYFQDILVQLISWKSDLCRHDFTRFIALKISINMADLLEATKFIIHCIIWYCFCLAAYFHAILTQLISCKSDLCCHDFICYITWEAPSIWLTCWKLQCSLFIVLSGTASVLLHTSRPFSHSLFPASLTFTAMILLVTLLEIFHRYGWPVGTHKVHRSLYYLVLLLSLCILPGHSRTAYFLNVWPSLA